MTNDKGAGSFKVSVLAQPIVQRPSTDARSAKEEEPGTAEVKLDMLSWGHTSC